MVFEIRNILIKNIGCQVGGIISDSTNRPWRLGSIGSAIGSAGITVIDDRRGDGDLYGREMKVTEINRADAIAAAAPVNKANAEKALAAVKAEVAKADAAHKAATKAFTDTRAAITANTAPDQLPEYPVQQSGT